MGQDPNAPKDPPNDGNPDGKQNGNPDPNVVALQQKLSQKDVELKKALEDIEALKKGNNGSDSAAQIATLSEQMKTLTANIDDMNTERKKAELTKKYPDVLPDLLLGKTDAEIETLVAAQRAVTKQNYGDLPSAHEPVFADRAAVDAEIERVKNDRVLTTDEKLQRVRSLKNKRAEF